MSTATCLVAAILITSGTIQRSTRPQTTLFLLICSIKVAPNGNKSHQELLFIAKINATIMATVLIFAFFDHDPPE